MKLIWSENDKIGVWDGTSVREFSVTDCDGTSATFEGDVAVDATDFWAVYPYNASMTVADGVVTTTIPAVQTIPAGKVADPQALVCVAHFSDSDAKASFKNAVSLVKVTVSAGENLTSIYFKGNASEKICGTVKFGEDAVVTSASAALVTLTSQAAALEPGDYYIAVAPGIFTSGVAFSANVNDGSKKVMKTTSETVLARNGGKDASDVAAAASVVLPAVIMTKAELINWAANADFYLEGETVRLGADIDLGGEEWTPAANFYGTFNGQFHNISGLVVEHAPGNAGFISTLGDSNSSAHASVVRLNVGTTDGRTYDGVSKVTLVSTDNSGWKYAAGVVAYAHNGSIIEYVYNWVPVTVSEECKTRHRAAGIAGTSKTSVNIQHCINYGDITDNQVEVDGTVSRVCNIAGIVGAFDGAGSTVWDCINEGKIVNHCPSTCSIGGIVGACAFKGLIRDCHNNGLVDQDAVCIGAASGYAVRVGGITGCVYDSGTDTEIRKCVNNGQVTVTKTQADYSVGLGGIVGVSAKSMSIRGCKNTAAVGPTGVPTGSGTVVGGIFGYLTGSASVILITKATDGTRCVNEGSITPTVGFSTTQYFGGIAGYINGGPGSVIEYADNKGQVKVCSGMEGKLTAHFGGVCGAGKNLEIRESTNSGLIYCTAKDNNGAFNLAGIIGGTGNPYKVTNCVNSGQIQVGKGKTINAAGIAANFNPNTDQITDCTNTGKFYVSRATSVRAGAIVAISKRAVNSEVTMLEGCVCDMEMQASEAAWNDYLGYVIGVFNNSDAEVNGHTATINVGSESKPVVVKLGHQIAEASANTWGSVTLAADNYADYLIGRNTTTGRDNDKIVFHTTTF